MQLFRQDSNISLSRDTGPHAYMASQVTGALPVKTSSQALPAGRPVMHAQGICPDERIIVMLLHEAALEQALT